MTFPLLYHEHYRHHLEDLSFWLDLADQQGDPILELGCGTGRVLIPLIKAGHRVIGLDNDLAMLSVLMENLVGAGDGEILERSAVLLADLSCFHLTARFSFILVPCNTWSTLIPSARQRSLERIYLHIAPGGLFVASIPNPVMLLDLPARAEPEIEESFEHPLSGNPVQVSSCWERDKTHFTVSWFYDHLLPDGTTERVRKDAVHQLSSTEDYLRELRAAGLHVSATWGDYDHSEYSPESECLILAATKQ